MLTKKEIQELIKPLFDRFLFDKSSNLLKTARYILGENWCRISFGKLNFIKITYLPKIQKYKVSYTKFSSYSRHTNYKDLKEFQPRTFEVDSLSWTKDGLIPRRYQRSSNGSVTNISYREIYPSGYKGVLHSLYCNLNNIQSYKTAICPLFLLDNTLHAHSIVLHPFLRKFSSWKECQEFANISDNLLSGLIFARGNVGKRLQLYSKLRRWCKDEKILATYWKVLESIDAVCPIASKSVLLKDIKFFQTCSPHQLIYLYNEFTLVTRYYKTHKKDLFTKYKGLLPFFRRAIKYTYNFDKNIFYKRDKEKLDKVLGMQNLLEHIKNRLSSYELRAKNIYD